MFKIIKSKSWTASNGNTGTVYTVAYQGRVFNVNSGDFDKLEVAKDNLTLKLGVAPVVIKENYTDAMGETKIGLRLKPKCDLEFGEF
jgi:hypothetical protein